MNDNFKAGKFPLCLVVVCLVVIIMTAAASSVLGVYGTGNVSPPVLEDNKEEGSVFDGDGNAMDDKKEVYPMPERMIFTSTAGGTETPACATLTATVLLEGRHYSIDRHRSRSDCFGQITGNRRTSSGS